MKPSEPVDIPSSHLLTVPEVAAELRVATVTVRRMIAAGDLRSIRVGRSVRIPMDALTDLLAG